MGRRRQHDAGTGTALLGAAEHILAESGAEALSVRTVAARIGTSARSVYSVFGSKEQLLVALSVRAFEMLGEGVGALPITDDPAADLVEVGVAVFRPFALQHPALFHIAMHHAPAWPEMTAEVRGAASGAFGALVARVQRLQDAGLLGSHSVETGANAFHALCEGLAVGELRGSIPAQDPEGFWKAALGSLVLGLRLTTTPRSGSLGEG